MTTTADTTAEHKPLISIGMPVYNAGEKVRRALDSILSQTETHFELIISDNCSTDETTKAITEEYASRDSRIRLTRQPFNQGIVENFLWVVREAKGEYFMWAAHDDAWSPNYVAALSQRLNDVPQAILSTPLTQVEQVLPDSSKPSAGSSPALRRFTVPAAPNGDKWQTLDLFFRENICVWMYGMFRTDWLKRSVQDLFTYPVLLGGDRLWLFALILDGPVVGDSSATFYYSDSVTKKTRHKTLRAKVQFLKLLAYHMTRLTWTRVAPHDRARCLRKVAAYIYRSQLSRHNPIGTSVRIAKLTMAAAWFGVESGIQRLVKPVNSRKVA